MLRVLALSMFALVNLYSQDFRLITNLLGERRELLMSNSNVKLVKLKKELVDDGVVASDGKRLKVCDSKQQDLIKLNSISDKVRVSDFSIYYDNKKIFIPKKIRGVSQALLWKEWVLLVVYLVDSDSVMAESGTTDLVFFKPDQVNGNLFITDLPSFQFQLFCNQ